MKRQAKAFTLLVAGLFLVVTFTDSALDRYSRASNQSSFTLYDDNGAVSLAYQGELSACKAYAKPMVPTATPLFLHRT